MPHAPVSATRAAEENHKLLIGIARAFGGAILFSLPLLMTMEMWSLGATMSRARLAGFMLLMIPLLIGLDHFSGFQRTTSWAEDAVDGMIAYGVGTAASAVILPVLGIVEFSMPLGEIVGIVALQAVPASLGAVLAASQFGSAEEDDDARGEESDSRAYPADLLFMVSGAVFLAFNVAPTEEMVLIAAKMPAALGVVTALLTLGLMHAFVYAVRFRGAPSVPAGIPQWSLLLRFTVVGYAVALLVSGYVLWIFGRFTDQAYLVCAMEMVVLAFPAGLGAAAARLIIV